MVVCAARLNDNNRMELPSTEGSSGTTCSSTMMRFSFIARCRLLHCPHKRRETSASNAVPKAEMKQADDQVQQNLLLLLLLLLLAILVVLVVNLDKRKLKPHGAVRRNHESLPQPVRQVACGIS
uniref:Uncharacterized protein n=1 Tax=Anopheles farauti TaxID=69004 RepID=A0A182QD59_9DIPT